MASSPSGSRRDSVLVEARLQGGAPWGFTLKGGLEHGEPLIVSKVEEGGKAGLLECPLLVGDEVVIINGVELSGFRQEAISLVKGSYRTLQLTVRRRSEPGSRPHSWHSTKLGEGPLDPDSMMQISQGAVGAPWHQGYHSSASTTDLSSYDAGFLRKSPDQYSSRGSMESLDPPHPTYSSCNQLSASKSSNSIDHLHSKRDSAYSSFSTSSSIPEYLAAAPSFTKERSYSMESVPQHRIAEGMQQADIRYVRTVYDSQQGVSEEHEVSSAALLRNSEMKAQSRNVQSGVCHRANSSSSSSGSSGSSSGGTSHRHSVGPVWGPTHNRNSYENLKGAPAPPLRSDSYAAIRNHERPNSWSSLEHARSLRSLHKGSWHHSSGSVASGKSSFGLEGQLHTVIEKSPESSPTIKPKQSFPPSSQPGRAMLPTGVYPVPLPEPHFAQIPTTNPSSSSVYPALAKESNHMPERDHCGVSETGTRMTVENGYQSTAAYSSAVQPHAPPPPKQSSQVQDDPQAKYGFYRSHLQPQGYMTPASSMGPERRDPYTPVQPRGERPRYSHGMDIMESYRQPKEEEFQEQNVHPQLAHTSVKVAQGQVVQTHRGSTAQAQGSDLKISSSGRYHSDSSACQQRDQDPDHPLTRLENALAEVQRCASPQSSTSQNSIQSERSMSVLEKISHFERQQTKPRSHSSLSSYSSSTRPSQATRSAKSSVSGLEDLQNYSYPQGRSRSASAMASHEGSTEGQLDLRPRYGSTDPTQYRKPHDLHRSKSSFQLGENNGKDIHRSKSTFQLGEENGKDLQWKDDLQDFLGTVQDPSFNRAYRDSIKDAQSKVLRSTSFRRRDLSVNPPPVPVKHMSLERKGPKTSPKPTTSPHTPKERHAVPVEVPERSSPPELPSVPPVGPPVMRICGRKRLTMEQKKMSYSEPENMHEVGISDQESGSFQRKAPSQFLLPETSVADRRRMFELVASRSTGLKPAISRPDLKQMQQDALAEYVERKTGRRMDGRPHRPHSAYMQSASSSSTDSQSLTSTPSLCSLQEPGPEGVSGVNRQSSTLIANVQRPFYSNRGTQVQAQPEIYHSRPQSQPAEPQKPERIPERPIQFNVPFQDLDRFCSGPVPQRKDGVFERSAPARSSGKSASAEDLLDCTEDRPVTQHFRSRSSPVVENYNKDFLAGDLRLFGIVSKEPPENRALGGAAPERASLGSVLLERNYLLNSGPSQTNTPVTRRERQRHSDRPRAHSASGLAASVGLPCPFSPPGSCAAGETQCQPNLDAITFPGTVHESSFRTSGISRDVLIDPSATQKTAAPKTTSNLTPPHLEVKVTDSHAPFFSDPPPRSSHTGPPTAPKSPVSPTEPLLSLRISESSLHFPPPPDVSQDDDEVFLAPPSPPPPPLPIRETDITEDLPFPHPPLTIEDIAPPPEPSRLSSVSEHQFHQDGQLLDHSSIPVSSEPSSAPTRSEESEAECVVQYPEGSSVEKEEEEEEDSVSLGLESPPLARRERSAAEVKVEVLARELVHRDEALAPLLDAWSSTSTLDLMEDIFPSRSSSTQQHMRSSTTRPGDRAPDAAGVADAPAKGGMETDLDEEELDLNQKVELMQALAVSVAVLHRERASLAGEQQRYSELGSSIETLVQQHCKPNEREKYRMFIGDLEKIVNLLLSLSGRLARVENALNALDKETEQDSAEERESLQQKRKQLCSQQEDARELKENLDRRERVVLDFLAGYLSMAQLRDYQRYVRATPALLIHQRHLDELIRHGEEQLQRLTESVPPELRPHATDSASVSSSDTSQAQGSNPPAHPPRPTTVTSL
ncbi:protein Shroom3 isoform X2 [Pygocentrus nattereri]|uniref:Protein Shroom3 n=1 Tax=Pygocentrus nattereri TaxID=42514 RepID=A0A3B4CLT8_PYGNA|nr:protein Shroom3 isoform X2 [Pygocentrus nattereri]